MRIILRGLVLRRMGIIIRWLGARRGIRMLAINIGAGRGVPQRTVLLATTRRLRSILRQTLGLPSIKQASIPLFRQIREGRRISPLMARRGLLRPLRPPIAIIHMPARAVL